MTTICDPGREAKDVGRGEFEAQASDEAPDTHKQEWHQLAWLPITPPKIHSQLAVVFITVFGAAAVRSAFLRAWGTHPLFVTFTPAVMLAALCCSLWAGLLATALSAAVVIYFWIEPAGNFSVAQPADWPSMAVFLLSCAMLCLMAELLRRARIRAHEAEVKAQAAYVSQQHLDALRQSEERFSTVLDNCRDCIYRYNLQTKRYEYASRSVKQILGFSPEEMLAKDLEACLAMIHPDDRGAVLAALARVEETGSAEMEYRQETRGCDYRWISTRMLMTRDGMGRPLYRYCNARDITGRKKAEAELRESEARHRALFDHNMDAVLLSQQPEGKVVAANPAACAMFGMTEEELCGVGMGIIDPDEPRLGSALEERARAGKFRGELSHIRKDGTKFIAEISSVILPGGTKSFVIVRDLAERKLLEKQLLQAEKLEAIGRLAGGVAHDLNNMMAAVILNADIIKARLSSDHALVDRVDDMREAGERAAELTRQLLAFSRKQVMCPKVVELNDLLIEVSPTLAQVGGAEIDLVLNLAADLGPVKADPGQIEQVVRNLALNARDAMPEGGKLTIATRNVDLSIEPNVELGQNDQAMQEPVPAGRYVMISVSDTGRGMNEETRSHLFEPFFTTKAFGKSSGLGLAIVYGIVRQSGGSIWVRSEVGRGTTFEICLPVIDVSKMTEAQPAPVTVAANASATILLVEDELFLLKLFHTVLEAEGYSVLAASSGEEALEMAHNYQGKVHLLLTDVILGGRMNGFELSSQLCRKRAEMKVIHMTGYSDVTHIEGAGVVSEMNLLEKPINADRLRRSVRQKLAAPGQVALAGG